jgi:hypothetical protein
VVAPHPGALLRHDALCVSSPSVRDHHWIAFLHREGTALPLEAHVLDGGLPSERTPGVSLCFTLESDWATMIVKDIVERVQLINNCCTKPTGRVRQARGLSPLPKSPAASAADCVPWSIRCRNHLGIFPHLRAFLLCTLADDEGSPGGTVHPIGRGAALTLGGRQTGGGYELGGVCGGYLLPAGTTRSSGRQFWRTAGWGGVKGVRAGYG